MMKREYITIVRIQANGMPPINLKESIVKNSADA